MARRKIQWHPLLGRLLRHRVGGYYDMQTNVPVGDLPRQGDIVLLRRTGSKKDIVEQLDVEDIMENLPPHKRRELLRRLNAESKS